jgi:hypothetical protein
VNISTVKFFKRHKIAWPVDQLSVFQVLHPVELQKTIDYPHISWCVFVIPIIHRHIFLVSEFTVFSSTKYYHFFVLAFIFKRLLFPGRWCFCAVPGRFGLPGRLNSETSEVLLFVFLFIPRFFPPKPNFWSLYRRFACTLQYQI